MANSVTITAKTGPNVTNTATVFSNVTSINYDFAGLTVTVYNDNVSPHNFSLSGVTGITTAVSGTAFTVTIG